MACKATLVGVSKSGEYYQIQFSDGSGINGTVEDILAWMGELYDNPEMAKRAALGKAFAQDPNFMQINSVLRKAVVLDPSHTNSIRVDPTDNGTGMASISARGNGVLA